MRTYAIFLIFLLLDTRIYSIGLFVARPSLFYRRLRLYTTCAHKQEKTQTRDIMKREIGGLINVEN